MAKVHIKRFFYRSGQTHTQSRHVNGKFHGLYRVWHRTGQIAEELRYRHGLLHGVSRAWDESGRLLGSFTMVNGTGIQLYWHDNGRMRTEISCINGKFHGRTRSWLRDGTLIKENYLISNKDVTRAAYLKAARIHPDWPQYDGETAGQVVGQSKALERKKHDLFIQSVFEKRDHAEARAWLNVELHRKSRSLAKFSTAKSALNFIEKLYSASASVLTVAAIYTGKRKKLFADWLLIQLPDAKTKRNSLRKICEDFCRRRGGAVLPDKDIGETHLFMMLHG